jgi:hypothetical protein
MRLTSGILGELAAAIKRSLQGSYETDIVVTPVFQPVISPRGQLSSNQIVSSTYQNQTFCATNGTIVTNSGAVAPVMCRLAAGLWELNFSAAYSSNFNTSTGGGQVQLGTEPPSAPFFQDIFNLTSGPTAGGQVALARTIIVSLSDNAQVLIQLAAAGVGQTHALYTQLIASKLL